MDKNYASQYYALIIFITGTLLLLGFAATLVIFLITNKKKRYKDLLDKQAMAANYQNQLLKTRLEVQEQSFKYFSEEIHDNIGQLLSIVKMQLYNIKNNAKDQDTIDKAGQSTEILGKAITDLRNISHTLNSTYVENSGLVAAVRKDLDYIRSANEGLNCDLEISGEEFGLGNEAELLVFRIIQEATANAIKHGSPSSIRILLGYNPQSFSVEISDNGKGFEKAALADAGLGLINMRERARMLEGDISVDSVTEKGTLVKLIFEPQRQQSDLKAVA